MMRTIELFSGTKSFSNVMKERGHDTWTIDNDQSLEPDTCWDLLEMPLSMLQSKYGSQTRILWASPPCQGFSVAVIGRNWNHDYTPKTESAKVAMQLAKRTLIAIQVAQPRYWFIENPRGMLRKMPFMDGFLKDTGGVRHTISYCQYGDTRQKPTDIWTNCLEWKPRPMCSPGSPCHVAAPRGSRTGTQGMANAKERGRIPPALFEEILLAIENN